MSALVMGIDGGGTHTRVQLADTGGALLGEGEAGTSNPLAQGLGAAQRELDRAMARAFDDARRPRERVAALCMGLGGADRGPEQQELAAWARANAAERVKVVNDAEIVLAAASSRDWGVALIAGTGSFAWGRNRAGETARAGGWGYLLGDEGSGFDLARQALHAITQAADGRGEPTGLMDSILTYWNLAAPQDLIQVYRSGATNADLARLAPIVLQTAEAGDAVAQRLVAEAAQALARSVSAVSRALNLDTAPFPLALTGGLALGSPMLRLQIVSALGQQGCRAAPVELVYKPVLGAVRLALGLVS